MVVPLAGLAQPPNPLPADHAERMERSRALFAKNARPILAANCLKCHGILGLG